MIIVFRMILRMLSYIIPMLIIIVTCSWCPFSLR